MFGERLTDFLNGQHRFRLNHVVCHSLADGHEVSIDSLSIERSDLLVVVATGPRGNEKQRVSMQTARLQVHIGPYLILGRLHTKPGSDVMASVLKREPMIPLTNVTIAYEHAGAIVARDIPTVIVNRMLVDWITPTYGRRHGLPRRRGPLAVHGQAPQGLHRGLLTAGGRDGSRAAAVSRARAPPRRRRIASPEHDVRQPDPQMRGHDPARSPVAACRPGSPRRASPSGPGSRRTARRRGWPGTGRARRRGTGRRRGPPRPRSRSRSRPARRARRSASQSAVITWRTGPNEAAVTTTSASRTAARASGRDRDRPDPVGRSRASAASASARSAWRSKTVSATPGRTPHRAPRGGSVPGRRHRSARPAAPGRSPPGRTAGWPPRTPPPSAAP